MKIKLKNKMEINYFLKYLELDDMLQILKMQNEMWNKSLIME